MVTQFVGETTEEEAGREICLHFYFFDLWKEPTRQAKYSVIRSVLLKTVLGLEVSRAWGCLVYD